MAATDAVQRIDIAQQQQQQESIDALSKEAEQLKARLEEERSKLSDVDRKWSNLIFIDSVVKGFTKHWQHQQGNKLPTTQQ